MPALQSLFILSLASRPRPSALCLRKDDHNSLVAGTTTLYDVDNASDLIRESVGVRVLPA